MEKAGVKEAIVKTFKYRAIFDYPLSFYQTYCYLITPEKITFEDFKNNFNELVEEGRITKELDLFHLGNCSAQARKHREIHSRYLREKVLKIVEKLKFIPFIKLICVTGSVASHNAPLDDDIDIMIVCENQRLWITRFLSVIILKIMCSYRTDSHHKAMVCPNIFVTEDSLYWDDRNVYIAHEIMLMNPIFDRGGYYFKFLKENDWVGDFLPHTYNVEHLRAFYEIYKKQSSNFFLNFFEKILMKIQLWYMKEKKTFEVTTEKLIHFKKNDHSERILREFGE